MEELKTYHKKEWILSAVIVGMAYFYLSMIRYPTALAGYIWWDAMLNTRYFRVGFCWLLFTAMFLAAGLWYTKACGKKIPRSSWIYFALTIAAGVWCPFYLKGDQDVAFFVILFLHGMAVYWLLYVNEMVSSGILDERGGRDLAKGLFIMPFSGYMQIFKEWKNLLLCMLQGKTRRDNRSWQVVLGLCISIPIFCIVVPILVNADIYFKQAVGTAFSQMISFWDHMDLGSAVYTGVWTMTIACYLFGLFYKTGKDAAVKEDERKQAPQIILGSSLIPVIILYWIFFAVRFAGITGAMSQIAEGDMLVSTYAREGFFELCWIAAINFVIFAMVRWYSPKAGRIMKLLVSALGAETIAFVMLAFSKMWYYIQTYQGFTFKRAMCCWFLLTLFVLFALMIAEIWTKKIKGIQAGVLFGSVTFLLMAYSNMPAWAP